MPLLGQSWLPKLGGIIAVLAFAISMAPDSAPGADVIKPWLPSLNALAAGLIGLTARQNNKTSEQVGLAPQFNPAATAAPNPPPKA